MLFGRKKEEKEKITLDKVIQDIEQKRQKKDVQKWEYLFVRWNSGSGYSIIINSYEIPYHKKEDMPSNYDIANQLGELGWELVHTWFHYPTDAYPVNRLIFKRPK